MLLRFLLFGTGLYTSLVECYDQCLILLDEKDGVSADVNHVASLEPLPEEKCASLERMVTRRGLQCVVALVIF